MILLSKTDDCKHIAIKSELISDFIVNPSDYSNLEIKATLNCCDTEEIIASIDSEEIANAQWTLAFPTNTSAVIKELIFGNIYTLQSWNVLSTTYDVADYTCSTGDITNLFPIIQAWFTTNFATTITQNYSFDGTNCIYLVDDLPLNMVPIKMIVTINGVDTEIYFQNYPVEGVFFTNDAIVISPEFFNLTEFVDGVYSFTVTFTKDNQLISQSSCFFFDCNTKCLVSERLEELKNCNKSATNLFLLHYTLTEGSNCGCNCDKLCEIFKKLCSELGGSNSCSNCGC
jgi:hypothetical protein